MASHLIGNRIYVKTLLFEGWAEVVGYVSDPLYPIEIELDVGDSDGHTYKRVGKGDIVSTKGDV